MAKQIWRMAVAGLALLLSAAAAKAETVIANPAKFVTSVYETLMRNADYAVPQDIYSPRLSALMAANTKRLTRRGAIAPDFDFWLDTLDKVAKLPVITARPSPVLKDRQTVTARFNDDGASVRLDFIFVQTKSGWKLDDVRSLGAHRWTLSEVLEQDASRLD